MVKFLTKLPEVFRERYLNTHEKYLSSIADVINYLYAGKSPEDSCSRMIDYLANAPKMEKRRDPLKETAYFRNLRNCWYHECALSYPHDSLDERMRFAAWKIIQCYYAVFSSIASIMRCFYPRSRSHDAMLNTFGREFLCHSRRKRYSLPPINFYLNQQGRFPTKFYDEVDWDYADSYHFPNIVKCLESAKEKNQVVTIPHYLKRLRDWVTYGDAYLFIRLYGDSPKRALDYSLQNIAFVFCVQSEFFLLRLFGWDAVNRQFETFANEIEKNLGIRSEPLYARFDVYSTIEN